MFGKGLRPTRLVPARQASRSRETDGDPPVSSDPGWYSLALPCSLSLNLPPSLSLPLPIHGCSNCTWPNSASTSNGICSDTSRTNLRNALQNAENAMQNNAYKTEERFGRKPLDFTTRNRKQTSRGRKHTIPGILLLRRGEGCQPCGAST